MERSTIKRLSDFPDLQRPKILRSILTPTVRREGGSPLLLLSLEDGCRLYNPVEDRIYNKNSDFSGFRFLGNWGKWFLVVDSLTKLYIIDVLSDKRFSLPPIESIKGGRFRLERLGDKNFKKTSIDGSSVTLFAEELRGVLWVDEKKGDYVVAWRFDASQYIEFCKNGDDHYREITTRIGVRRELRGLRDMVLKGYNLYVLTTRSYIRLLDLSGQDGFKDVSESHKFPMYPPYLTADEKESFRGKKIISDNKKTIALTTSGEVLMLYTAAYDDSTSGRHRIIRLYKRDPNVDHNLRDADLVEVVSLGDEALLLDMGITLPADHTLGIEPNSIYFTRDDRIHEKKLACIDICVYNLATKTFKRFSSLSELKIKDAQWFLPF